MVMCVVVPPWDNLDLDVLCSWCTQHDPTQCGMNSISLTTASCVWWHMAGTMEHSHFSGEGCGVGLVPHNVKKPMPKTRTQKIASVKSYKQKCSTYISSI